MADLTRLLETLEKKAYTARYFDTAQAAADYLDLQIDGQTVGIGGSQTVQEMDLYPRLGKHNRVIWHWEGGTREDAMTAEVYISSANALAETGEIVNIDGMGNRIASTFFGHQRVYFVIGVNKITPDFESALFRARNVAAPRRAQSLGKKTPCAVRADRCYDCQSPERICCALGVLWAKPVGLPLMEVILVGESLGL